ncbi:MAG: hypothetical protein LBK70_02445 [Clostridiales bacterium]|jgi:dipicolinate synthase subunit A|nr:hypothetical protein [Clostridiales bacterium]
MKIDKKLVVDTSDPRNQAVLELLLNDGSDVVSLPMLLSSNSELDQPIVLLLSPTYTPACVVKDINMPSDSIVFYGKLDKATLDIWQDKGITMHRYFDDQNLTLLNADLTAEGALASIIDNTKVSLLHLNVLLIGNGRVATAMTKLLSHNHVSVSILSREQDDKTYTSNQSITKYNFGDNIPWDKYHCIVNTVPAMVLDYQLHYLSKDCFVLDVASLPGGVDFELAKQLDINTRHYLAIPSRVTPLTAASYIIQSIFKRLKIN